MPDSHTPLERRSDRRFGEIEADARRASERYRLYRARTYGPRLTSPGRLRELKREAELAEKRLANARAARS
jgi:hypothetical protein